MKFLFIDETSDANKKDYFGICIVLIDSSNYKLIKDGAQKILKSSGWDPNIEFKGSTLFSSKSGDTKINVEKRLEIAENLLSLNLSSKNSRIKFAYCDFYSPNFKRDYLENLPKLISKLLPSATKRAGKNLLSVHYDNHDSISPKEVEKAIEKIIKNKKYYLFEDVIASKSNFETIGILYADLVVYLYGRHEVLSKDKNIEKLSPDQTKTDHRVKKIKISKKLLKIIKNLKAYEVK